MGHSVSRPVRPSDAPRSAIWLAAVLVAWMGAGWPIPTAFADGVTGRAAYDGGDYARARSEWQSAADAGDADAQFGLGTLYEFGLAGLPQDYKEAAHWYELSAAQHHSEAAYRLALIWAVGNPDFPPDVVEGYKWVVLAGESKGSRRAYAVELRGQLDQVVTPAQQAEGKKRADAWRETHYAQGQVAALASAPDQAQPPFASAAVPPPLPELTPPAQQAAPVDNKAQLSALNDALGQINCAAVSAELSPQGEGPRITGVVSGAEAKAQLAALAGHYFPSEHTEVDVVVTSPPLCRSFTALAALHRQGLVTDGDLHARLVGGNGLREGDPIKVEVVAPAWAVSLRIDYFSLDGQVQHLWPNDEEAEAKLATGAARVFGDGTRGKVWRAGGAPFGTESIAVIATPLPLNLGSARPAVENGTDYLRDVAAALARSNAADKPNLLATILVTTHGR
jgi:hypothetical protein